MNAVIRACNAIAAHESVRTGRKAAPINSMARLCDVTHAAVVKWRRAGVLPADRVLRVWQATRRAGMEITPYELCPEVFTLDGKIPRWPRRPRMVERSCGVIAAE